MDLKQLDVLAFQVSLFVLVLVFGYGLRAKFDDLIYLFRRPALLARSLIAVLVVMPVVAIVLAKWFEFTPKVEIALVALAVTPLPPLSAACRHPGTALAVGRCPHLPCRQSRCGASVCLLASEPDSA